MPLSAPPTPPGHFAAPEMRKEAVRDPRNMELHRVPGGKGFSNPNLPPYEQTIAENEVDSSRFQKHFIYFYFLTENKNMLKLLKDLFLP